MLKRILLASAVVAASLTAASNSYKVKILSDTTLDGKQVKAGEYKIELDGSNATLRHGKQTLTVPAHTEQAQMKYSNTQVQYVNSTLHEIHIGGTSTKIVFGPESSGTAGGGTN